MNKQKDDFSEALKKNSRAMSNNTFNRSKSYNVNQDEFMRDLGKYKSQDFAKINKRINSSLGNPNLLDKDLELDNISTTISPQGLNSNTSGNTLTEDDFSDEAGSNINVSYSRESQEKDYVRKSMLNAKKISTAQTNAITGMMSEMQKRTEAMHSKYMKTSIQIQSNMIAEMQKANNFRYSIQANYYKSSIDYKKSTLSELQQIHKVLRLGFNINDNNKVDETRTQESFARLLFGSDYKKGLKGGLLKSLRKAGSDSDIFNMDTAEIIRDLATRGIDSIRQKGLGKTILTEGIKMGGKKVLGKRSYETVNQFFNHPEEYVENLANAFKNSKNPFLAALGTGFGTQDKSLSKFDPTSYYKQMNKNFNDRSNFDKKAHTSLTNVIPNTLSKILAVLSKKEATYFNYATGKYESESSALSKLQKSDTIANFDNEYDAKFRELERTIGRVSSGQDSPLEKLNDKLRDKNTRRAVFGGMNLLIKSMATKGRSVKDLLFIRVTPELLKGPLPNTNLATRAIIAQFLEVLKNYQSSEIQSAFEDIIEISEQLEEEWEKDISNKISELEASNAAKELLANTTTDKENRVFSQNNNWHKSDTLSKLSRGIKGSKSNITSIAHSYNTIVEDELQKFNLKGVTLTDLELRELGDFFYKGEMDPLLYQIGNARIAEVKGRLKELESLGEGESLVAKALKGIINKYENNTIVKNTANKVQEQYEAPEYEQNLTEFIKNDMTGATGKLKSFDPKDVKTFASSFLLSDKGDRISRTAQFASVTGALALMGKKAGMGKMGAVVLGGIGAAMLTANGRLNSSIKILTTEAGDLEMDDGRTKRDALIGNLMKDILPAGFASVTGVKVNKFIRNNLRFGGVLGPIMGFTVGSTIFGISKLGIVRKLVGGLFKGVGWILGGLDKKFLGGFFSNIFGGIKNTVTDMIPQRFKGKRAKARDIYADTKNNRDIKDALLMQKENKYIDKIKNMTLEELEKEEAKDNLSDAIKTAIEARKAELGNPSGSASSLTIAGSNAGTCAPAVLSKLMDVYFKISSDVKDFVDVARNYLNKSKTGIRMNFFNDMLSTMGVFDTFQYKGLNESAWESLSNKNNVIIGHINKENGHFVLFYGKSGNKIRMYDPMTEKDTTISMAACMVMCDIILLVEKSSSFEKTHTSSNSSIKTGKTKTGGASIFSGIKGSSFGVVGSGGLARRDNAGVQKVQIVGGFLDTVGLIGTIDAESYRSKMQKLGLNSSFKSVLSDIREQKDFFTKDKEAKSQLKEQDEQERREQSNTSFLERIANGRNDGQGGDKKDKPWWMKLLPYASLLMLEPVRDFIGKSIKGLIDDRFASFGYSMSIMTNKLFKKLGIKDIAGEIWGIGKKLGKGGKKLFDMGRGALSKITGNATAELAQEGIESVAKTTFSEGAKELAEETGEALVKGAGKSGGMIAKLLTALSKASDDIGAQLVKLPVIGKLLKKIPGKKIIDWFCRLLPGISKRLVGEVAEEASQTLAQKGFSLLAKGLKATYGAGKGILSVTGVGNAISAGFAIWDINSSINNASKIFNIPNDKVSIGHKAAAGTVTGLLSLIEAIVPFSAFVIIPIRVSPVEGFLIREFYKMFNGEIQSEGTEEVEINSVKNESEATFNYERSALDLEKNKANMTPQEYESKKAELEKRQEFHKENASLGTTTPPTSEVSKLFGDFVSSSGLVGGKGSGIINNSLSRNEGNNVQFFSQNSFMKTHNIGGAQVKDAGCALAVGKMISKFFNMEIDNSVLYSMVKKYILKDGSIGIGFFKDVLGGSITNSANDVLSAVSNKGGASVLLIQKGAGYHYIAVVNYNNKILYGDPESNGWQDVTNNTAILTRFEQACVFGNNVIVTNLPEITTKGGRGFLGNIASGIKNFFTGRRSSSSANSIGFGNQSVKGSGTNVSKANNVGRASGSAPKSSFSNFGGSNYEYLPAVNAGDLSLNSGASINSGGFVPNGVHETLLSVIGDGEMNIPDIRDPKLLGRASNDTAHKGSGRPSSSYGIIGVNTLKGNSYDLWEKNGYNDRIGIPKGLDKDSAEYKKLYREFAEKNPTKMLEIQKDFFVNHYLPISGIKSNSIHSRIKSLGFSDRMSKDLGMQSYYVDLVSQYGGGGASDVARKAAKESGGDDRNRVLSSLNKYDAARWTDRTGRRRGIRTKWFNTLYGKAGGSPLMKKLGSYILKYNAKSVASKSNGWDMLQACGPSLAMILHSIYFPSKDLSGREKDFLNIANMYKEFGTGYTKNEYFSKAFGGYEIGLTEGRNLHQELDAYGVSLVLNRNRHFEAIVKLEDGIYLIDPTSDKGTGKVTKINSNDDIFNESIFVAAKFNINSFKDIDMVIKVLPKDLKDKFSSGSAGAPITGVPLKSNAKTLSSPLATMPKSITEQSIERLKNNSKPKSTLSPSVGFGTANLSNVGNVSTGSVPWMDIAEKYVQAKVREGDINHKKICAGGGINVRQPWCGAFVATVLTESGHDTGRWASSQEPVNSSKFRKLDTPVYGAIAVFANTGGSDPQTPKSVKGHIGFYAGEGSSKDSIILISGNHWNRSSDNKPSVTKAERPINGKGKKLVGYYWVNGLSVSTAPIASANPMSSGGTVRLKGGAIGGFIDSKGNHVDISGAIQKYLEKKHGVSTGLTPNVSDGNVSSFSNGSAVPGGRDLKPGLKVVEPQNDSNSIGAKAAEIILTQRVPHKNGKSIIPGSNYGGAVGLCARSVKMAIDKAQGKSYSGANANCFLGVTGNVSGHQGDGSKIQEMQRYGYSQISVASKPQIGDVLVYPKPDRSSVGHICMYTRKGWVSDFTQKSHWVYNSQHPNKETSVGYTLWRYGVGAGGIDDGSTPIKNTSATFSSNNPISNIGSSVFKSNIGISNNAVYKRSDEEILASTKMALSKYKPIGNTGVAYNNNTSTVSIDTLNKNIEKLVKLQELNNETAKLQLNTQMENTEVSKEIAKKDYNNNVINNIQSSKSANAVTEDFKNLEKKLSEWKASSNIKPKTNKSN